MKESLAIPAERVEVEAWQKRGDEEKTRLEEDLETLERNLEKPIKLDLPEEGSEPPIKIKLLPGKLSEEDARRLNDFIEKEIRGKGQKVELIDTTLADEIAQREIGYWTDEWPKPAPAPSTYRLAYRKNSLGGIFRVLIDADYEIRIGTDLSLIPVSRESFEKGSEGGKWWSESMVIPFQEEEETEESGTDDG